MAYTRATLFLGAALVLGTAQGATAADLGNYGGGSIKDGGYAMPMEAPRPSLYFRLDGTHSSYDTPSITEDDRFDLIDSSIDSNWGYGGGVGMYFGRGFRGDLTIDRLAESDVTANLADPLTDLPGVRTFGLTSTVALANVYYDFDFGNRFTPYVGLGLGFTRNKTSEGTVTDPCGCLTGTIDSGSETHVAGAAMAGFQIKLRDRLSFDAGYRFLYLGEASTGAVNATYTAPVNGGHGGTGTVSQDPTVEDIHAHQFRLGLRYDIN
ncbi:MAG: porin family protein [Hyphomicrobium sp.]|nr:porin family protein [Hyphomicrobium sp.]